MTAFRGVIPRVAACEPGSSAPRYASVSTMRPDARSPRGLDDQHAAEKIRRDLRRVPREERRVAARGQTRSLGEGLEPRLVGGERIANLRELHAHGVMAGCRRR